MYVMFDIDIQTILSVSSCKVYLSTGYVHFVYNVLVSEY